MPKSILRTRFIERSIDTALCFLKETVFSDEIAHARGFLQKAMSPRVKIAATTLREVHSTNRHSWSAIAWIDGKTCVAPTYDLDVHDRVGGGDGFASGFIYGLLAGEELDAAVRLGCAHGALLTTYPGDTTMATLEQVKTFAAGGSARIQR